MRDHERESFDLRAAAVTDLYDAVLAGLIEARVADTAVALAQSAQ